MPAKVADPEVLPLGPITRSRARKFREVLSLTCSKFSDSFEDISALDNKLFNVLHTDVEVKEHDVRNLRLARLKFRSSNMLTPILESKRYKEARFTGCHVSFGSSDDPEEHPPNLQMQAIIREIKKSLRDGLEPIHDRLERLEGSQTNHTDDTLTENGSDQTPNQRQIPRQGRMQQVDDNLTNIKIAILSFQGRTDPDAYLAWESKVEHVFECYNYSEQKKVRIAAMEFIDYALIWWDQLLIRRRRIGEGPVRDWAEMKRIMWKRKSVSIGILVSPSHYHRDLFQKLQGLKQGKRSVEDYFKEMEDREATMARFLNGLNTEIANVVELQHYVELDEMVHMAIKVEQQQRRRTVSTRGNNFKHVSNSPFNASNAFRKPAPQAPLQIRERTETSKPKPPVVDVGRGKQPMHPECTRDIQCFKCLGRGHVASQCPNRRTMLMLESGEIESESKEDEQEFPKETVREEDDTLQSFETEEALVIKRNFATQPTQDNQQRENIFHTRCLVNDKVCVVIIDGGSCTNIVSSIMVEKFGLATTKHPNHYRLQWLKDGGEIKVTKQVLVPFTIGKYKDEVLCDVVAMGACHLLLGPQRSSKLLPRGDGPFQVVERVNENAYKLDLPGEYNKGDDVSTSSSAHVVDPEVLPQGPVTRSKAKQFRDVLSLTCAKLLDSFDNVCALDSKLYNVLHADM
ncbi:hypothetical protein GQ457_15G018070 [Hibiscus cannabinus]